MTVVKNNLLRHDGEGRLLDQTGAFLTSAAQSIGSAVVTAGEFGASVITAATPVLANTAWTIGVFGYTAIAATAITGCSVVGNIAVAGYKAYHEAKTQNALSGKAGQAVDTVCKETSKTAKSFRHMSKQVGNAADAVGSAAGSLAKSADRASDSCRLFTIAASVTTAIGGVAIFRHSVCATDPDSIFCISPFLTTLLVAGVGLRITCKWAGKPPSHYKEKAAFHHELQKSHEWRQQIFDRPINLKPLH